MRLEHNTTQRSHLLILFSNFLKFVFHLKYDVLKMSVRYLNNFEEFENSFQCLDKKRKKNA